MARDKTQTPNQAAAAVDFASMSADDVLRYKFHELHQKIRRIEAKTKPHWDNYHDLRAQSDKLRDEAESHAEQRRQVELAGDGAGQSLFDLKQALARIIRALPNAIHDDTGKPPINSANVGSPPAHLAPEND